MLKLDLSEAGIAAQARDVWRRWKDRSVSDSPRITDYIAAALGAVRDAATAAERAKIHAVLCEHCQQRVSL